MNDWRVILDEDPAVDPNDCEIELDLHEAPTAWVTRKGIVLQFEDAGVRLTITRSQALVAADMLILCAGVSRSQMSEWHDAMIRGRLP